MELGGKGLVVKYRYSMSKLLNHVYPEHDWLPWKFDFVPANGWDNNIRKFMESAWKDLKINKYEDWYNIPKEV